MSIQLLSIKKIVLAAFILLLAAFSLTACQPAASETDGEHEMDHEHEADHEHEMDHEHDDAGARVPNEGAVVRILTPTAGATFKMGEDIVVEVETENFDLNAEGNHWHLYVDGSVLSMLAGGATKTVLHDLEPGDHEIEVYLGLPSHEELEEGASLTITVTE